jgi:hypothetical protein
MGLAGLVRNTIRRIVPEQPLALSGKSLKLSGIVGSQ